MARDREPGRQDRREHGGSRRSAGGRPGRSAQRRVLDAWQGAAAGASFVFDKILGAMWPAPRPGVLPIPVRTTPPGRSR
ncbi:MAG: hypothetical protein M0010_07335 [Actinomycetota bacterium]|nr:hypothetical protein [Actinomycetota bacterium]